MFDIFVNDSIRNDGKCFNISADYNFGNLCSFFADCINHHLMLELTIMNESHVTFVEGKNITELVVEIPNICLCQEKEAPGIDTTAIVMISLSVIGTLIAIVVGILTVWFGKKKNIK